MGRITLRSVWRHKRRLVSTVLAIVLGVGFMSGTLILSSTLDRAADDLFGSPLRGVDAVVEGQEPAYSTLGERAPLPEDLLHEVASQEGVGSVAPSVHVAGTGGTNRVLNANGRPMGTDIGPGTSFENWITASTLTPFVITDGRAPRASTEVALNEQAVTDGFLQVGGPVTILGTFGPEEYSLVGAFRSGRATESSGGAITAAFTLPEVQRLAGREGLLDAVRVEAEADVDEADLVAELGRRFPDLHVAGRAEAEDELRGGAGGDLGFLQLVLVVFGVVALLVGTFVIANTFSILVAQRTKELALLRALGASRPQVFGAVLAEAAIVGAVSSGVGLVVGVQVAGIINRGLQQIGARLPADDLVLPGRLVLLCFLVGLAATVAAALLPALRATRVPPVAALREQEVDHSEASRGRLVSALVTLVLGGVLASDAWRGQGDPRVIPVVGLGGVLVLAGLVVGGPFVAGRIVARARGPLRTIRGVNGRLAADNAARSPRRTSATAAAVMISVALVVFVMAFASSAARSIEADARRGFAGDFIVTSGGGLTLPNGMLATPIPVSVVGAVAAVDGVAQAAAMGYDRGEVTLPDGSSTTENVTSVDADGLGPILRPAMVEGDGTQLDDDGIFVDRVVARRYGLTIGDQVRYSTGGNRTLLLEVQGISDDPNVLGYFTVTRDAYLSISDQPRDVQVGGRFSSGADPAQVLQDVRIALQDVPTVWVFGREAFVADLQQQVGGFITVIYGLLVLSVVISVLGVSNTLSLTIHERTRELGLLRSLGMDRAGVRSMVRWEAVLIGLLGTFVGLVVGLALSVAVVRSLRDFGLVTYAIPRSGLVAVGLAALVVGVVAAIRPAHRAAELSILDALGTSV